MKAEKEENLEDEVKELQSVLPIYEVIEELERRMFDAASLLDFEKAAKYRDMIRRIKKEIEEKEKKGAKISKRRI